MLPHIALTGKAGCGKDTAGRWLVERHGYRRASFADGVRDVLLAIDPVVVLGPQHTADADGLQSRGIRLSTIVERHGWERAKRLQEVRTLLQRTGTEAGRDIFGPDVWVNLLMERVRHETRPLVVTDVRFPNEADACADLGAVVVRIRRDGAGAGAHVSETAMDGYPVAYEVDNNGSVDDLHAAMDAIVLRHERVERENRLVLRHDHRAVL